MLKLKTCSNKFKRTIALLMVCFVATLSVTAPVAFAAEPVIIEAESDAFVPVYGATIRNHTRWFSTDNEANIIFNAPKRGNYTFSIKGNGEQPSSGIFKVDGTTCYNGALENTNTWTVDENAPVTEFGTVYLTKGEHTLNFKQTAVASYFMDYLSYTFEETALNFVSDNIIVPDDVSAISEDSEIIYDGDIATGIILNGWAEYRGIVSGTKAYTLSVMLEEPGEVGVEINGTNYGIYPADVAGEYCTLGDFSLNDGENIVKIYCAGTPVVLSNVRLKLLEPGYTPEASQSSISINAIDYINDPAKYSDTTPGLDAAWSDPAYAPVEVAGGDGGKVIEAQPNEWLTYEVYIPEAGYYAAYVRYAGPNAGTLKLTYNGTSATVDTPATADYGTYNELFVSAFEFTEGVNEIRYDHTKAAICFSKIILKKVDSSLNVYSAFKGDAAIINGTVLARGTDAVDIYCTNYLSASNATDGIVTLYGGGKTIPVELNCADEGTKLEVILKDTLDYDTEYTLTVESLTSTYGSTLDEPMSFTFTTGDEVGDEGYSSAEITGIDEENGILSFSGVVKSSKDVPVAGRKLTAKVKHNGSQFNTYDIGLSQADGLFTYQIDLNGELSGIYAVSVLPEYGEYTSASEVSYVTPEDELLALAELKTITEADIAQWFTDNGDQFGVTLKDHTGISDYSVLYNHFVGGDYTSKTEFDTDYDKYLVLERLMQGDAEVIVSILENADLCNKIGVDGVKAAYLIERGSSGSVLSNAARLAFAEELAAVTGITEPADYVEKYNEIADKHMFNKAGMTLAELKAGRIDAKKTQTVEIPVEFTAMQNDFAGLDIVVECADEAVINGLYMELSYPFATVTKTVAEDKKSAAFAIKLNNATDNLAALGSLMFDATAAGTYTLKLSSTTAYILTGADYTNTTVTFDIATALADKEVNVYVADRETTGGGGGSSGGGVSSWGGSSGGSSSGGGVSAGGITGGTTGGTQKGTFSDLAGFDWAQDSIQSLTDAGVISKSEDGKYYPERAVTREEFVKMLVIALGFEATDAAADFADVDTGAWYAPYIAIAKAQGITNGKADGSFGIGEQISRQDMATLAWRALELAGITAEADGDAFADDADIEAYAKASVYNMKKLGIINGVGDNKFDANGTANRAMAAKVIAEMRKVVAE